MPGTTTGVYPCYENQFQIDTGSGTPTMSDIKDCESFSVSFDNGVEEWYPFDTEGWVRRLLTAKAITITVTAKRHVGDAGNDAVAAILGHADLKTTQIYCYISQNNVRAAYQKYAA